MKSKNIIRTAAIVLLSVCTICVITYFSVFSAVHNGHDCASHHCSVCRQLQTAKSMIRQLSQAVAAVLLLLGVFYILSGGISRSSLLPARTLISDKVRMDR